MRPNAGFSRSDIMTYLGRQNVETRPIICGNITRQPAMLSCVHRTVGDLKHADVVVENGFSFGNHQHMGAPATLARSAASCWVPVAAGSCCFWWNPKSGKRFWMPLTDIWLSPSGLKTTARIFRSTDRGCTRSTSDLTGKCSN